jgi:ubiquinone biosynthesis protein
MAQPVERVAITSLAPETVEAIGRAEGKRWRWATIAQWVIAALIAYWLLR